MSPETSLLIVFACLLFIFWAIITQSKAVGALAQLGGLQERELAQRSLISRCSASAATAKATLQWERLVFTASVANVAITFYILGASPSSFFLWHSPKAVILIFSRWLAFVREKPPQHYLLLDLCYWANMLLLYYCWVAPTNAAAFQVLFLAANGPLAWSVLAFNQSLVFHSWQHVTSVFIHVSPMLLTYGLRWNSDPRFRVCADPPACAGVATGALVGQALRLFYVPWLVGYYLVVFVILGSYIHKRGFQTLFNRVATKGPLAPLLARVSAGDRDPQQLLAKTVYVLVHATFGVSCMTLSTGFFFNQAAHFIFVAAICLASTVNASSFYFTVFPIKTAELLREAAPTGAEAGESQGGDAKEPAPPPPTR